jgi:hypothetical protein
MTEAERAERELTREAIARLRAAVDEVSRASDEFVRALRVIQQDHRDADEPQSSKPPRLPR